MSGACTEPRSGEDLQAGTVTPRVGLRSDAVMLNVILSPQTPGGTAVSCYATSLPLPPSPSSLRPFEFVQEVTSLKKKRDEKPSTYFI